MSMIAKTHHNCPTCKCTDSVYPPDENKKSRDELLAEFAEEINQMIPEEVMKGIYAELKTEKFEGAKIQYLKAESSSDPAGSISQAIKKLEGLSMHLRESDPSYEIPRVHEGLIAVAEKIDEAINLLKEEE